MARRILIIALAAASAATASGCGSSGVKVAKDDPDRQAAEIFAERCGGCHTLSAAGTQGSTFKVSDREKEDGPNFDVRHENADDVEFAIENGGFSGAIMPENIVTGEEMHAVARFIAKYAGSKAPKAKAAHAAPAPEPAG